MPLHAPSRRSVLKAGAWTAPAIVLATAAPSYAASGGRTITISSGLTAPVESIPVYLLDFDGFTITPDSAITANSLTMTVTNPDGAVYLLNDPAGWTRLSNSMTSIVWVYASATLAGETVPVPNGAYLDDDVRRGTFIVTVTAPDHDAAQVSFAIPV